MGSMARADRIRKNLWRSHGRGLVRWGCVWAGLDDNLRSNVLLDWDLCDGNKVMGTLQVMLASTVSHLLVGPVLSPKPKPWTCHQRQLSLLQTVCGLSCWLDCLGGKELIGLIIPRNNLLSGDSLFRATDLQAFIKTEKLLIDRFVYLWTNELLVLP